MTKAEFIRWAARREKAANALREARRLMGEMVRIDDGIDDNGRAEARVDVAMVAAGDAIQALAAALDCAAATTKARE